MPGILPSATIDMIFGTGKFRRDLIRILRTDNSYLDQLNISFKERGKGLEEIVNFYEQRTIHHYIVSATLSMQSRPIGSVLDVTCHLIPIVVLSLQVMLGRQARIRKSRLVSRE